MLAYLRAFSIMAFSSDTGVGRGSACDSLGRHGREMLVCLKPVWSGLLRETQNRYPGPHRKILSINKSKDHCEHFKCSYSESRLLMLG